ncbi:MAG: substrate-binding domain-containing protein [Actinobacteria bacterium]|nr:substrate-binding domain-containing protein [Actinomycetota bacterium]
MIISGCASSSTDEEEGSGGAPAASVAKAQEAVDGWLEKPTSIGDLQPLTERPPTDIHTVYIHTTTTTSEISYKGIVAAGEVLGWRVTELLTGATPEDYANTFQQALDLRPDAIMINAAAKEVYEALLPQAEELGIVVISDNAAAEPGGALLSTAIDGPPQFEAFGRQIANYVVATSESTPHVQLFTLPVFQLLSSFDEAFEAELTKLWPGSTVEVSEEQVTGIGNAIPGSVVGAVTREPEANWVVFDFGSAAAGVPQALAVAGVSDRVQIAGAAPDAMAIDTLAQGATSAWATLTSPIAGWRMMDLLARHFVGDDVKAAEDVLLPLQLLTEDNVDDAVLDSDGNYVGQEGYEQQFAKLWQLD